MVDAGESDQEDEEGDGGESEVQWVQQLHQLRNFASEWTRYAKQVPAQLPDAARLWAVALVWTPPPLGLFMGGAEDLTARIRHGLSKAKSIHEKSALLSAAATLLVGFLEKHMVRVGREQGDPWLRQIIFP